MAQQNPSIINIVHRIATRLEREVNDRLPRRGGHCGQALKPKASETVDSATID